MLTPPVELFLTELIGGRWITVLDFLLLPITARSSSILFFSHSLVLDCLPPFCLVCRVSPSGALLIPPIILSVLVHIAP